MKTAVPISTYVLLLLERRNERVVEEAQKTKTVGNK